MALSFVVAEGKEELNGLLVNFRKDNPSGGLKELFECLSKMCADCSRPIVLMIDEVDSASNNQVFIDFLAQLRGYYLTRDKTPIFHSVILAGVYDIKNLKLKLRNESEHQYNSPWNTRGGNEESEHMCSFDDCSRDQIEHVRFDIAAEFSISMSFSASQIASVLEEYEGDYHTDMDIKAVAEEIYDYTSGYPVLVSLICKRIDEKIVGMDGFDTAKKAWSHKRIEMAVKMILVDNAPLFESMKRKSMQQLSALAALSVHAPCSLSACVHLYLCPAFHKRLCLDRHGAQV